jgi:Holliday junction resolvase-like predicted endonuclease
MTHGQLVRLAERWLRRQRYRIILTEQTASSGEVPDVIGWRDSCRSIVIECKISRPDFLADSSKVARRRPESAMGCERFYLTPAGMLNSTELPSGWGLLEAHKNDVEVAVRPDSRSLRTKAGLIAEMELLLASLRRVEIRIEPQTITEFLKWKNRMAAYNGGRLPEGLIPVEEELRS